VPRVVLVASGKGGVGKTTVAVNLALALSTRDAVALLDADMTAPNAHLLLGLPSEKLRESNRMLIPPKVNGVEFMSIAMFFPRGVGLAWSHEKVADMIKTLIRYVRWDSRWLVVDLPPSSIDVNIEVLKSVGHTSRGVIVGEPHRFAFEDNLRMLDLMRLYGVDVRCIVLNKFNLYPNADLIAREYEGLGLPVVRIPFDPELAVRVKPEADYWIPVLGAVAR